ncbi:MAG TPA: HXXEE domain-containing protein [Pseudolysinimonas sp.]|jgi:hypothetical protein
MRFFRNHWYDVALALAVVTLLWQAFARYDGLRLILLLNLVAMLLHEVEEYRLPGGAPWLINLTLGSRTDLDRTPLNQVNGAFNNVAFWAFYLIPVIWPDVIWLGLAPVLVGLGQFLAHGILCNIRIRSVYNPGLATVIIGFIPLGIWYLIEAGPRIQGLDWVLAIVEAAVFMLVIGFGFIVLGKPFRNRPFTPEEMARFDGLRRLKRLGLSYSPR